MRSRHEVSAKIIYIFLVFSWANYNTPVFTISTNRYSTTSYITWQFRLVRIDCEKAARIAQRTIPLHNRAYVAKLSGFTTVSFQEFRSILRPIECFFPLIHIYIYIRDFILLLPYCVSRGYDSYQSLNLFLAARIVFVMHFLGMWKYSFLVLSTSWVVAFKSRNSVDCGGTQKSSHRRLLAGTLLEVLQLVYKMVCVCRPGWGSGLYITLK